MPLPPSARAGSSPDLAVHGAGIYGLSIAFAAARRGARVVVVDPRGVAAGASGGIVGALAPHTPERWNDLKAFQLQSLLEAGTFWAEVAHRSGRDPGYARLGRLQPIADARALALAHERTEAAAHLWQGKAAWRIVPAVSAGDWVPQSATGLLVEDTLSARIHPSRACAALAAAITALGGSVMRTFDGAAGATVWATGWEGLTALGETVGELVGSGVKGQAALLACNRANAPQIYADSLNIVPHADGTTAVGSTSERTFDDGATTDAQLDALLTRAVTACPALHGAPVLARWAGVRPRCRTRAPLLGPYPGRPGHFIANGGFKIGFGMAPRVGDVMADLILDQRDNRPERFRTEALITP